MNDVDNQQARAEAVDQVPRALRSARRAHLWAGLNRYLAAEAGAVAADREAARHTPSGPSKAGPRRTDTDRSET